MDKDKMLTREELEKQKKEMLQTNEFVGWEANLISSHLALYAAQEALEKRVEGLIGKLKKERDDLSTSFKLWQRQGQTSEILKREIEVMGNFVADLEGLLAKPATKWSDIWQTEKEAKEEGG